MMVNFWYDRAAFYFLKSGEKIYKYISVAENLTNQIGYLIFIAREAHFWRKALKSTINSRVMVKLP